MNKSTNSKLAKIKTSSMQRRLSIAKASLKVGGSILGNSTANMFGKKTNNEEFVSKQAQYFVEEIGKLKGSVVKIGQMLALYGQHYLPKEVVSALQTLNNQTVAIDWLQLQEHVKDRLGSSFDDLEIDPTPLGTASLAQVHYAKRRSDGLELVLKIQYPGVAQAIDSDLKLFKQIIKLSNLVPQTRELDDWFSEIRDMLHNEVDYFAESSTTKRFYDRLRDDERYVVPKIIGEYSCNQILAMTYEKGIAINSEEVLALPQQRRNAIGEASLQLFIRELFEWGEMQTDPNYGNYLLRIDENGIQDKIVLLDFGAVRQFDDAMLTLAHNFFIAGNKQDKQGMIDAMADYPFFAMLPEQPQSDMADTFLLATEPFVNPQTVSNTSVIDTTRFDDSFSYIWKESELYSRLSNFVSVVTNSPHFAVPPKEFMFIMRKFIGAYAMMTLLEARSKSYLFIEEITQ